MGNKVISFPHVFTSDICLNFHRGDESPKSDQHFLKFDDFLHCDVVCRPNCSQAISQYYSKDYINKCSYVVLHPFLYPLHLISFQPTRPNKFSVCTLWVYLIELTCVTWISPLCMFQITPTLFFFCIVP